MVKRAARSRAWQIGAGLAFAVVAFLLAFGVPGVTEMPPYRIDLDVYRLGGQVFRAGGDLYGPLPPTESGTGLPFTYPPIAALVFATLTFVSLPVASVLMGLTSVACLALVIWLVLRELTDLQGRDAVWLCVGLSAVALVSGPVRETFGFGQINIYLMALVVVDVVLGRDKWWRGSLVGLAAAIKLTPAVFLLFFLLRKDVRAVIGAGVAFLGAHLIGFVVAPDDSVTYWTKALTDPSRIGGLGYASNQSINGELYRLGLEGGTARLVWIALVIVLVIAISVLMVRLLRRNQRQAALVVIALAGLYASPVSWAHHWVWAIPAMLVLGRWLLLDSPASRGLRIFLWVLIATGLVVLLGTPHWWFPNGSDQELAWTWYMHLLGNGYLWWGLAALAAMWWYTTQTRPTAESVTVTRN